MSNIKFMDHDYAGSFIGLIDFFYPVGCYFETSDSTFNPNTAWGGTWALETEGQVHVSAGTNYAVNGALSNTTDGGESSHILTPSETALKNHSHYIPGLTGYADWAGEHSHGVYYRSAYNGNGSANANIHWNGSLTSTGSSVVSNGSHQHTVYTYENTTGGVTEANGSAHNNMQPYINVYRWHRTA